MIELQTYLDNAVKASRSDSFAKSDQLTLGEIISKCEAIEGYQLSDGSEPCVVFDFEYMRPTDIDSWRGSYAELALNFEGEGCITLPAFIGVLKAAVGKTYTGYKGGDFAMSRHTPVWVANYGNSGNTAIIDVVNASYQIILITGYREF